MQPVLTRNPNLASLNRSVVIPNEIQAELGVDWFTGLHPEICPGFDSERQTLTALPLLNLRLASTQDALDYFENSWTLTELLFQSLKTRDAFIRPPYHQLRHPMLFYYGHPAVLFINKLRVAGLLEGPVDLYLEKVLETGVDEMSWDDLSKNEMEWPSVRDVRDYRKKVHDIVANAIRENFREEKSYDADWRKSPVWALVMGFEHEKIHFETSSVLIRELPIELVERPKYFAPLSPHSTEKSATNSWKESQGGTVKLGKPFNYPTFGWDNEYGNREVKLSPFHYSSHLISNSEFFEFVSSGAYTSDKYWQPEGLAWRKFRNTKRPTFWALVGPEGSHEYRLRTLFEYIEMPWDWPVEVNYHESKAYAHWKSEQDKVTNQYRLLTEAEFALLSRSEGDPVLQLKSYSKGLTPLTNENFNFKYSSASKVDGLFLGNVWHWTEDQFNPLEDFSTHPLYEDFSTPCFDGKHQMILGGSFMSCGHEASIYARFHFRPHFYQHSGFRLAQTVGDSEEIRLNGAAVIRNREGYQHHVRENALNQMSKSSWWENVIQPLQLNKSARSAAYRSVMQSVTQWNESWDILSPQGRSHDPAINFVKSDFKLPYQPMINFPDRGQELDTLLSTVTDELAPQGQLPGHKGYMAYVAGRGNEISSLAQWLSMTLNPYSSHYMMSPGLVAIEEEALGWFKNLFKFGKDAGGFFTTGSSLAVLQVLGSVRNSRYQADQYKDLVLYVSELGHHCVKKAWAFLGASEENLKIVKSDSDGRMLADELESHVQNDSRNGKIPFMIVGTAGSTNTGCIDPLDRLGDIAEKFKMWYHVDGAYGAVFALTGKGSERLVGLSRADSMNFDLHKSFSLPYGTGCLLFKNKSVFFNSSQKMGSYMPTSAEMNRTNETDYADFGLELSRDYRGLRVWLPLKHFGIGPFILNLEEKLALSEYLIGKLKSFKAITSKSKPDLTITTFGLKKYESKRFDSLLEHINNSGKIFVSTCELGGERVFRVCLLGYATHKAEVDLLLELLKEWDDKNA